MEVVLPPAVSRAPLMFDNFFYRSLPALRVVKHTFTALGGHEVTLTQIIVATGDVLRTDSEVMVKVRLSQPRHLLA